MKKTLHVSKIIIILFILFFSFNSFVYALEETDNYVDEQTEESINESDSNIKERTDESVNQVSETDIQYQTLEIEEKESVTYQSHVQDMGWLQYVNENEVSGTVGLSRRVESIRIKVSNLKYAGSVEYQSHVQDIGWMNWVKDGELSGTTGISKRIEALRIKLTGEISEHYDVYYRVYAQGYGWLGWAKNGEDAGTAGYGYRLEAYQVVLLEKGDNSLESTDEAFKYLKITYQSHVQDIGWMQYVKENEVSGTVGLSRRVEGIRIKVSNLKYAGSVEYQSHVQDIGWMNWVKDGELSGTTGISKRIEALRIKLTGEISEHYDVYYRVYAQGYGWLGWAKNGEDAGTAGYGYRLEAYQVVLLEKGDNSLESTDEAFKYLKITYQSHVQDIGWMQYVKENEVSGTVGLSRRVEGIRIKVSNLKYAGSVEYQSHVQDIGWMNWVKDGELSGTTGISKRIEALRIKLTGEISEHYDIYYRVQVQNIGWLGWAKNGEDAGTAGYSYRLEAYQVMLVEKGSAGPVSNIESFRTGWVNRNGVQYYTFSDGTVATGVQKIDGVRYMFDSSGALKYSNVKVYIDISSHQGNIDFDALYNSGLIDGVILRIGYWTSEDAYFKYYINEIKRLNIPYSVYLFSYAHNSSEALEEAKNMLSLFTKYQLNPAMNVYYDLEGYNTTVDNSDDITKEGYQQIAEKFIGYMDSNGIGARIYSYYWFANNRFNEKTRSYLDWIAQYSENNSYQYNWRGWQYTDAGSVPGINTPVDMSIFLY